MEQIDGAVARLWSRLVTGEKVDLPTWEVEHPAARPDIFRRPTEAWPVGQTCDYVMSFGDGSRVHAQCMNVNGQSFVRIHRDRFDPDHSIGNLVLHGLTETPIGVAFGIVALIILSQSA